MLTFLRGLLAVAVLLAISPTPPASAAGMVCEKYNKKGTCLVWVPIAPSPPGGGGDPIAPPGGGGGSGGDDPCGYTLVTPQPPATDPIWGGVDPAKADIYLKVCPGVPAEQVLVAAGIGALPPPMDPAELAGLIIVTMDFDAPPIETMPPAGSEGAIVGIPTWLWLEQGPTTTGPQTASDSQGGVSVTVTAQVTEVTWDMGDGAVISCGIGTPYDGSANPSPTCGHVYEVKSTKTDPNAAYTVTATATWTINWTGGGEAGTEILTFDSTSTMRVTEINVLNVPPGG